MAKVTGLSGIRASMKIKRDKTPDVAAITGYTQSYALRVHEDLEAHHENGQAKYLEQPMRELEAELFDVYAKAVQNGATHEQAVMLMGLRLQRESQQLVPVDTGALRASAFTRLE